MDNRTPTPDRRDDPMGISSSSTGASTRVYIHGGYWQWNDKERDAFLGEGVLAVGVNLVLVEHTLAPAARMDEIVREVRGSIAWEIAHRDHFTILEELAQPNGAILRALQDLAFRQRNCPDSAKLPVNW